MKNSSIFIGILCLSTLLSCENTTTQTATNTKDNSSANYQPGDTVSPLVITEKVNYDTDDPAIYYNPSKPGEAMVLGTDKDIDGSLFVFDLKGKIQTDKVFKPLQRPNNCDVNYGLTYKGTPTDIAIVAERFTNNIRIIKLPEMIAIDGGGIPAFKGDTGVERRALMGVSSYKDMNNDIHVIIGRKAGPTNGTYLHQYKLKEEKGIITGDFVRAFGHFSGIKEIEAIAVDQENGFIYYSDEQLGTRKYYADPEKGNEELALFGADLFAKDNEGIAIYNTSEKEGFIFISDQEVSKLQVFDRLTNKHLGEINYTALETDGIEVINHDFNGQFPGGLLVAMSTDKTFHYYSVNQLLSALVKK